MFQEIHLLLFFEPIYTKEDNFLSELFKPQLLNQEPF